MAVLLAGEIVVDWLSTEPGKPFEDVCNFYRDLGGNAANVAIGVARLGTKARFLGKVGTDRHGDYLRRVLEREGVQTEFLLIDEAVPTAQCYMTTSESGAHNFYNWPRPNAADQLCSDDMVPALFESISLVHSTGISFMREPRRTAIGHCFDECAKRDIVRSFDACFPTGAGEFAREHVERMLYQSELLKFNRDELRFWAEGGTSTDFAQMAAAMFEKYRPLCLFVTLAEAGALILTAEGNVTCAPLKISPISEVGAGDAFIAGVLHRLHDLHLAESTANVATVAALTLSDWEDLGRCGNVAGALATRSPSAYGSMATAEEMNSHLVVENSRLGKGAVGKSSG